MNRSLTRQILRAAARTPQDGERPFRHVVEVEHVFPPGSFADAPAPWTPGSDFTEQANGAWLRDNGDGTQTAVVTGVGPKQLPAADGGTWVEEEVWTVTTADSEVFAWLDDKAHRVTWALGRPDVEIARTSYSGHPHEGHADYWHEFQMEHGFTPALRPDGRYVLTLACSVSHTNDDRYGPSALVRAVARLLSRFGGRASVRTATSDDFGRRSAPAPVRAMGSVNLA
ncbi:hypothetical protein ACIBUR_38655 [Streptomyces anulatus]